MRTTPSLIALLALGACTAPVEGFDAVSCDDYAEADTCEQITADDVEGLQELSNSLDDNAVVVLGEGTFTMDNQLTIRSASGVSIVGQGMDLTTLDFGGVQAQTNGVDVIANDFLIEGLTILDAKKDGLRVEDSDGVTIRAVRATWTKEGDSSNGAYGLYPVKVRNVLMEDSEAFNASDAGIYVGQCVNAIIRNNVAKKNVAGIEIENTQYADVYGNLADDNTAGLVVFDLPGNPIVGHDIDVHGNTITNNNRPNFAPGGVVRGIPAGTGTFAMASRRVHIHDNAYENNGSTDIAVISGLVVESDPAQWALVEAELVGDIEGIELQDMGEGMVANFRTYDVLVEGNTHTGSGTAPDNSSLEEREFGFLLAILYGSDPVDTVLYDSIGESSVDPDVPGNNSNDNRICVNDDPGVTFASLNVEVTAESVIPTLATVYQPEAPFAPFDCDGFGGVTPPANAD